MKSTVMIMTMADVLMMDAFHFWVTVGMATRNNFICVYSILVIAYTPIS